MIIAFTGAGISKDSGVPTFDEMPGIRDKLSRTFANENPKEFQQVMDMLDQASKRAQPNAAHLALAKHDILVLTMNIDELHQRAGSRVVVPLHGRLPDTVVLYEDPAPNYSLAYELVGRMEPERDLLLIVGTSFYTGISAQIKALAQALGVETLVINQDAATEVPRVLEVYAERKEAYESFLQRECRI